MDQPVYQGLLLIDCAGLPDSNPFAPVRELQAIAAAVQLKTVVLVDIKSDAVQKLFQQNGIAEQNRPEVMEVATHARMDLICKKLSTQYGMTVEHCIYFVNQSPDSNVSVIEGVRKTGARVLSLGERDQDKEIRGHLYLGADSGEYPHTAAIPVREIIDLIMESWKPGGGDRKKVARRIMELRIKPPQP